MANEFKFRSYSSLPRMYGYMAILPFFGMVSSRDPFKSEVTSN